MCSHLPVYSPASILPSSARLPGSMVTSFTARTNFFAYKMPKNGRTVNIDINACRSIYIYIAPELIRSIDYVAKGLRKQFFILQS